MEVASTASAPLNKKMEPQAPGARCAQGHVQHKQGMLGQGVCSQCRAASDVDGGRTERIVRLSESGCNHRPRI